MSNREYFAALLANDRIMFWTCLNEDHKHVTWTGDMATCDTCGLTSEMTACFARDVQAYERDRLRHEMPTVTIQVADGGVISEAEWNALGDRLKAAWHEQMAAAAATERESIRQLALHKRAVYCIACDGAPCGYDDILRPFADLLTDPEEDPDA